MMSRTLRRSRTTRGYTMSELTIAAALTGLLLAATIAWVTGLLNLTTTQAAVSVPRISAQFVTDQLRSDLANAVSCSSEGLATPLLRIEDDELHLYISTSQPGASGPVRSVARVSWLYDPATSQLSRSQVPDVYAVGGPGSTAEDWILGPGGALPDPVTCDLADLPEVNDLGSTPWVPVASYVSPETDPSGSPQPVFSGVGGPDPSYTGDCNQEDTADACMFTHLRARFRVDSPAGTSSSVDRSFTVNTATSRL